MDICGVNMAKKKRKKIASRGSVNDIILKTLINGDKYGYEIIKEVEEYSEGKIQLKQPSLYSSLSRFEEKGLVSSYWGDSDIGGRRHYYHLTESGQNYYTEKNSRLENRHSQNFSSANQDIIENTYDDNINIEDDCVSSKEDEEIANDNIFNSEEENIVVDNEKENGEGYEDIIQDDTFDNNPPPNQNDIKIKLEEINSLPAFADFEETQEVEDETIVPDHNFHPTTPIEEQLENSQPPVQKEIIKSPPKDNDNIWKILANKVKLNNKKYSNSKLKTLYFKKSKIVILDKDGIYKLRDKGYIPSKKSSATIIDNVGKRIEPKMPYMNYSSSYNKSSNTPPKELTEEERKIRNENFLAKFNSLTKSKMKPVPEKIVEEKPKIEIDYRKKLDAFMSEEDDEEIIEDIKEESSQKNNLFNYVDEDEDLEEDIPSQDNEENDDEIEDKFINFEPEEFEVKSEDKKYIEEISQFHSTQNDIKINRYENKSNAILSDKSYVLINKVKCLFGIILFVIMTLEISLSLIIFKNNNVIFDSDKILFIIAYAITIIISLAFILPIFFSPNDHKVNTFKLKYTMIFGVLTFLVSIILVYCINSLIGFDLNNFKYFAVKIILPIILTFNFVIMPPIYSALIKNKKFYD